MKEPTNYYNDGDRDPYHCQDCDTTMYEVSDDEIYCTNKDCVSFEVSIYRTIFD